MQLRQSLFQGLLAALLGFCLTTVLHACQATSNPPTATATPAAAPVVQAAPPASPKPLPPETRAIVQQAGAKGLFQPERGNVRFVVFSDLNSAYGSVEYDPEVARAIKLLPFWNPDLVLCGGDMVAGQDPTLSNSQLKAMWAAFDQQVAAPLRRLNVPFGFTLGNHDASSALGAQRQFLFQADRDAAAAYWKNPMHDPGVTFLDKTDFPFHYTFEANGIFFLVWDASSNRIAAEKLAWAEKALASDAAQSAKMRVVIGHLPLYAVSSRRNNFGDVLDNTDGLLAMMEKYRVHTYISGHHHAYYPAQRGQLQLLHVGILGQGPRYYIDSDLPPRKSLTVVDVKFDDPELTTYTTYDMQTLKVIANEELPRSLKGVNGVLIRRDVKDLSQVKPSVCQSGVDLAACQA